MVVADLGGLVGLLSGRCGPRVALVAEADRGVPEPMLRAIDVPTLILTGVDDGPVDGLASLLPHARVSRPPGHHLSAPLQPAVRDALVAFLR